MENKKKSSLNSYLNGGSVNGFLKAFFVFAVLMVLMGFSLNYVGLEGAKSFVKDTGAWAPITFVFVCSLSVVLAPLSGSALYAASGALFGMRFGFLYSLIAMLIGCSVNFWLSRVYGRRLVIKLVEQEKVKKIDDLTIKMGKGGWFAMLLAMLLASDFASYIAGLTKMQYKHFVIILLLESSIGVGSYIIFGGGLLQWLLG